MATQFGSPREGKSVFGKNLKGRFQSPNDRGSSTSPRSKARLGISTGTQGEHSGNFDEEGRHLTKEGNPDMRFKENREDFEGQDFGGSSNTNNSPRSRGKSSDNQSRGLSSPTKGDGTPDMRFKQNREDFSGQGFENTTSNNRGGNRLNKTELGIYEGNTPGEHSGKFDMQGHHLKSDNTPDMRFKENRDEFTGQGFEQPRSPKGNSQRRAKYSQEEDIGEKKVYYRRKRPPTPYALFIRERAPEFKRENQDMDMNEVFRQLGSEWSEMSDKEHDKYYDMYNDEVKRYEEAGGFSHRGGLSLRKLAERNRGYKSSKGKFSIPRHLHDEDTAEEEDDDYEEEEEDDTYTLSKRR